MNRISQKDLELSCAYLNRLSGFTPETKLWNQIGGSNVATIGMYYIGGAYGGVTLYKMVTSGGGVSNPLSCGYVTKRELYNLLHAYIRGIEAAKSF